MKRIRVTAGRSVRCSFIVVARLDATQRRLRIRATPDARPSLPGAATAGRARRGRAIPAPHPRWSPRTRRRLVAGEGGADDPDVWVVHDPAHHTAIMPRAVARRERRE